MITGDFDSITKETLHRFANSKIIKTPDQNATDFTKALLEIKPYQKELKV